MISGVRGGTIDMEMSGSNNFAGLSPVMNLLDVPFLFRDTAHAHKTLDGKVGDDLKVSLEGKGLKVLAYWEKRLARCHQLACASENTCRPERAENSHQQ